jgi:hypothetical protein
VSYHKKRQWQTSKSAKIIAYKEKTMGNNYSPQDLSKMLQSVFSLNGANRLGEAENISQQLLDIGQEAFQEAEWSPQLCQAALRREPRVQREDYIHLQQQLNDGLDEIEAYLYKYEEIQEYDLYLPLGIGVKAMLNASDAYIATAMSFINKEMPKINIDGYTSYDNSFVLHGLKLVQTALSAYGTATVFFENPLHSYPIRLYYVIGQGCRKAGFIEAAIRAYKKCAFYSSPDFDRFDNLKQESKSYIPNMEAALSAKSWSNLESEHEFSLIHTALGQDNLVTYNALGIINQILSAPVTAKPIAKPATVSLPLVNNTANVKPPVVSPTTPNNNTANANKTSTKPRKKDCRECNGSGKIGWLLSKSTCVTCDGKGYIVDPASLSQAEKVEMASTHSVKGASLIKSNPNAAIKKFNLALEYNSSLFEAHIGRIMGASEAKDYNAACNYADILTTVFPENGNAHYFKSGVYHQRSGVRTSLDEQVPDLRIAHREIELALDFKCTFKDAKERYYYLRDWLKECEDSLRRNKNYSLFGPNN